VEDRPKLRVVNVERIAGRIVDEPGDNLSRFDGDLPVGESAGADVPTQDSADDEQDADRPA
jgi:hypothetical protein